MLKTEKQVKQQARAALKGNFTQLIATAGLAATAVILVQCAQTIALLLTDCIDINTQEIVDSRYFYFLAVVAGSSALTLLISPLFNGFIKAAVNTAVKKTCEAGDAFYYFRGAGRYFKTLLINLILFLFFSIITNAFNPANYLQKLFPQWYEQGLSFNLESTAVVAAETVATVVKIIVFMLFVHFPLLAYALNDNISVGRCVFVNIGFAFKNVGKLFRLVMSFIGWFALCFFVVPLIYVVPYYTVAAATSARWLYEMDNNRGFI